MILFLIELWVVCVLVMLYDPNGRAAFTRLCRQMLANLRWIFRTVGKLA